MAKKKTIIEEFPQLIPQFEREIGIEIEMEGVNLPPGPRGWATKADGSLRGEAVEWVLERPQTESDAMVLLTRLENYIKECKSTLLPSDRCGVHIHINVQDMLVEDVIKFVTLYLVVEDLLVRWCGEDREGNLFCLRGRDAEFLIRCLLQVNQKSTFKQIVHRDIRYASLNLTSLAKFGSLEFRSLRTPKDFGVIKTWIKMLLELKNAIHMFKSTEDIIEFISLQGGRSFLKKIFPTTYNVLITQNDINGRIIDSARLIQDVAYAEKFKPKKKDGLESYPYSYWSMMINVYHYCHSNKFTFEKYNPWDGQLYFKRNMAYPGAAAPPPIESILYGAVERNSIEDMGEPEEFSYAHQKDKELCKKYYDLSRKKYDDPNTVATIVGMARIPVPDEEEDVEFDEDSEWVDAEPEEAGGN